MGFLEVSNLYSELADPGSEGYDSTIGIIEGLMTVLTFGLFLSFAVVGIRKAVVKARSMDSTKIKAKIKNIRSRRGLGAMKPAAEAATEIELRTAGAGSAPPEATTPHHANSAANPMKPESAALAQV